MELIPHQEINAMIYDSQSPFNTVPAIVFHSWISQNNSTLAPDSFNCENTFLCYASCEKISLFRHHQLIISLYEILKDYSEEPMLLLELFAEVRDHYFKSLFSNSKGNFNDKNTRFYSNNSLRYPLLIKQTEESTISKLESTESEKDVVGLFFLVCSDVFLGSKWIYIQELFETFKKKFKKMNYLVGEDIVIRNKQNYLLMLAYNANLTNSNCKSVFAIVVSMGSSSTGNSVSFGDGTYIDIAEFSKELANSFPKIPKVLFVSQIVEKINISLSSNIPTEYEHMMVVHSIESELSNSSLIRNFAMGIKNNYFAEIHTILRTSILNSTQSTRIQIVDGLRKNFYINYHGHIAQLLNTESDEFKRVYKEACMEGTEWFHFYRLMLVGPEEAGKTSLLRVLTGKKLQVKEKTTKFIDKYNLQVQKLSHDWDQIEELDSYIQGIDETMEELAMKIVADMVVRSHDLLITPQNQTKHTQRVQYFSGSGADQANSILKTPILGGLTARRVKSVENIIDSTPHEKISSTQDRIQSLRSKTNFFTAWDFAGQDYLYCFHSLFLSPRSVYLLLIDLTIKDLEKEVVPCHREDRHVLRSQSGVPRTYLEVYEFWLNAIFSVSKTALRDSYNSSAKIILVFSKADEVVNPEEIARQHLQTIKSHMYKKNNAFELVHEEEKLFIISCKANSPYFNSLTELKSTIKRISDQVAFEQPIPIRWLKLANDILRDEQPILDKYRIQYLAECCNSSNELNYFLHFFNGIGLFFHNEGSIITDIQKFLDIIYFILFPQVNLEEKNIPVEEMRKYEQDIKECTKEGKLSIKIFDYIINCMKLSTLREPILELLQMYGILTQCESEGGHLKYFYIPYLLSGSLKDVIDLQLYPLTKPRFFIYFPDGFLPAPLYFILLSNCLRRREKNNLPKSTLGFDCAVFYVCESLLVSFELFTRDAYILISFYIVDFPSLDEEYIRSEIVLYLTFLQLFLVKIQTILIPCGNFAKIMFVCDSCETLSLLKNGLKPPCSLDIVLSLDPTIKKRFCCDNQMMQLSEYIAKDPISHQLNNIPYESTMLAHFIINEKATFAKYVNWRKLSTTLYSFGLITIQTFSTIIDKKTSLNNLSEVLLMEMVHKGPLWANIFFIALNKFSNIAGHRYLLNKVFKNAKLLIPRDTCSIKTFKRAEFSNPSFYKMNRTRHGIAFIVNIESFGGKYPKRLGSKHDVASLRRMFNFLQYDTRVYEDLTRAEYIKVQNYIRALNHSEYDSFFCVIMSHGNEKGEVIFSNEKSLKKDMIVAQFSPKYCEQLKEKPKIFIFQACRGTEEQTPHVTHDAKLIEKELFVEDLDNQNDFVCRDAISPILNRYTPFKKLKCDFMDTFIGDSTVDQFVSYRKPAKGSFFIQSLCSVMQSCSDREFTHIMMEVRRHVSLKSNELIQCTEDTNRLQGPVYF